jgi:hypothetical protein
MNKFPGMTEPDWADSWDKPLEWIEGHEFDIRKAYAEVERLREELRKRSPKLPILSDNEASQRQVFDGFRDLRQKSRVYLGKFMRGGS